jgi:histidinol-phosphate aminotransferase
MTLSANQAVQCAPGLSEIEPYTTAPLSPTIELKLDGNEGLQPDARLLDALARLGPDVLRRYPNARPLEAMLARQFDVEPEQIIVTAGADEALDRACRAALAPGRQIILPTPTFEMLPRYARLAGAEIISVPWPGGAFPTQSIIRHVTEHTAAIAIVSPNNPTGAVASASDVQALAAAAPHALLIVDLAYADFAEEDLTASALALPNAVAIRSLSKSWGLAGLRVGYAAGPPRIIRWLRAAGGPYSVSGPSLALAMEWLQHGGPAVRDYVERTRAERTALGEVLRGLSAEALPSQANFVLARFANAERVWQSLAQRGIAVRRFLAVPELANALRITCPGNEPDFRRLTATLREVVELENWLP